MLIFLALSSFFSQCYVPEVHNVHESRSEKERFVSKTDSYKPTKTGGRLELAPNLTPKRLPTPNRQGK